MTAIGEKRGINGFVLKWIAIITMLIDHTGSVLVNSSSPVYPWLRTIGRVSFPIFCFLLVEGFVHTKDRNKYALRLGIFALLSEIPYDLAFYKTVWHPESQNVFFTLFLAFLALMLLESTWDTPARVIGVCLIAWSAVLLHTDYNANGVVLVLLFYVFRKWKLLQGLSIALTAGSMIIWSGSYIRQLASVFALIPILLYNGKRGPGMKYFFYFFYPGHLLILFLIRHMIY